MKIAGSGYIAAGEYEDGIKISGGGKIEGNVRCKEFICSGGVKALGDLICEEELRVSGGMRVDGAVKAKNIRVSGELKAKSIAADELKLSGNVKCSESIKCKTLSASGDVEAGAGIEAEDVELNGNILCAGLLNAENVNILLDGMDNKIGSIGGSSIKIAPNRRLGFIKRAPIISGIFAKGAALTVNEEIEGECIDISCVKSPLVVGRKINIGPGAEIDLVRYSEELTVDAQATVKASEKIL